jgi:outer membrane protein assembly factor BamB
MASDWPQFRGLQRNGHTEESQLLDHWPDQGPPLAWTATGMGAGFSSAAIADGTIYVTGMAGDDGEGVLTALDTSGTLRWKAPYGKEWDGTYPGARYTPTVDSDTVYFMTGHGVVCSIETKSGGIRWRRDVGGDFGGTTPIMGFAESLLVDGDQVFCTPGGKDASIVALDTKTGATRWTSVGLSDQAAYCSPILVERGDTRLLITLTNATLIALDPETGAITWRVPFDETEKDQNHAITPVYHDGQLYVTSGHRKGGVLFVLSADGKSIEQRWTDTTLSPTHGGVVHVNDHLYGSTARGRWACLSLADGAIRWEERGVGKGSLIYGDGHLYCYGEKGKLALAEASSEAYTPKGLFKIEEGEGPHWAHPSIARGRLYIRHGDTLLAYRVAATE